MNKHQLSNELVIGDYVLKKDVMTILGDIKRQLVNGKLEQYHQSGRDNIACTCPIHSGGHEKRPSAYIYIGSDDANYGTFHCFTCGKSLPFTRFVAECFDRSEDWATRWLVEDCGYEYKSATASFAPKIELDSESVEESFLDESILDSLESYHPYMTRRKLTDGVIKKFDIKYDPKSQCIVFPVRDQKGRLKFLTRRSVNNHFFLIGKGASKADIYALDKVIEERHKWCIVCESQINALTCWSWGYPSIALLGAGTSKEQMNVLNKTDVRMFVLAYDPDAAGDKGAAKFEKLVSKDKFVVTLKLPAGKDVNDLTKEEFDLLLVNAGVIDN